MTDSLREDQVLRAILDRLHAASEADVEAGRAFWADKYVALDRDKAEFC